MTQKKISFITSIVLIILFQFSSCKNKEKEAEDTLEDFIEAVEDNDFEKAKEKSSPETHKILDLVKGDKEKYEKENNEKAEIKIEITDKNFKKNHAFFKIKIKIGEQEKNDKIKLILVEDKWKVDLHPKQISILRGIVFFGRFEIIIKNKGKFKLKYKNKKTKKHKRKST